MNNIDKHYILDLLVFGMFMTVSFNIGLLHNQFSDKPLPLVYESNAERLQSSVSKLANPEPSKVVAMRVFPFQKVPLDSFHAFVKEKHGLVLDARPEIFYRFGHVSLPRDEFEKATPS